jgi:pimeloyl-ACP methyl ester carboxylesterase
VIVSACAGLGAYALHAKITGTATIEGSRAALVGYLGDPNDLAMTLLMYGANSWASNPEKDGRLVHFNTARVIEFADAGHWLHHDQFDRFMAELKAFL